ncbi:MAG: DUF488 family protein [Acidimicrobiia bacterium]|nr:DUF488 family protein [Acidimicrobiia bacterium]
MTTVGALAVARIYDEPMPDTARFLVDRLWPRGVSKGDAALDAWLKDVAPSTGLRKWYDHDVDRFVEFGRRYRCELDQSPASEAIDVIASAWQRGDVVLLTATRDVEHSGAMVLMEHLIASWGDG